MTGKRQHQRVRCPEASLMLAHDENVDPLNHISDKCVAMTSYQISGDQNDQLPLRDIINVVEHRQNGQKMKQKCVI